jgi:uncharacterized membrane protein YhfC
MIYWNKKKYSCSITKLGLLTTFYLPHLVLLPYKHVYFKITSPKPKNINKRNAHTIAYTCILGFGAPVAVEIYSLGVMGS